MCTLILCSVVQMCFYLTGCYNYLYRMKALDAIRDSGERQHLMLKFSLSVMFFGDIIYLWVDLEFHLF